MAVRKTITPKQRDFAAKYVELGGNGTQAALQVYDANNAVTAGAIASENLTKPLVVEEIKTIQQQFREDVIQKLRQSKALDLAIDSALQDLASGDRLTRKDGREFIKGVSESFGKEEAQKIIDNRKVILNAPKR